MPGPRQPIDYSGLGEGLATGLTHVLKAGDYSRELGATLDEYWDTSGEKTLEELEAERERQTLVLEQARIAKSPPEMIARFEQNIETLDTSLRQRTEGATLPELRDSLFQAELTNPTFWEMERSFHEERIASYYPAWVGLDPKDRQERYDDMRERYAPLRITNPFVRVADNLITQRGRGGWGNPLDIPAGFEAGGAGATAQWLETAGGIMKFAREDLGAMAPDELPAPIRALVDRIATESGVTPLQVMDDLQGYIGASAEAQRKIQQEWSRPGFLPALAQGITEAGGFVLSVKAAAGLKAGYTALPLVAGAHGRNASRQDAVVEGLLATALLPAFRYLVGPTDAIRMAKGFGFGTVVSLGEDGLARLEDFMKLGLGDPAMATHMLKPENRWFQKATGDDMLLSASIWAWLGRLPHGDPVRRRFTPQQERWQDYQKKSLDVDAALARLEQPDMSRGQRGRAVAGVEKELNALREQADQMGLPFPAETTEAFVRRLKDANGVVRRASTDNIGMREAFRREMHRGMEEGDVIKLNPSFLDDAIMPFMDRLAYRFGKNNPHLPSDAGYATLGFRYSENPPAPSPGAQEARRVSEQRVARTRRTREKKRRAGAKQAPAPQKQRPADFELRPDPAEMRHKWLLTEAGEHPEGAENARLYLGRTPSEGGPAPVDIAVSTSTRAEQDAMDRQKGGAWKPVIQAGQTTRRAVPARGKPKPYYPDYREGAMRPLTVEELENMIEPIKGGGFRVKGRGHVITPDGRLILELPDGKHAIAGGPARFEDRIKVAEEQMTPDEIMKARTWYERLEREFSNRYGPDLGAQMLRAHLALQVNTGPEAAYSQLMKIARHAILGEKPEKGVGGLGKEAAQELLETEQVGPWTRGMGKKIMNFIDSGTNKQRSTIYGNDERIGAPLVADVWDGRARGFTDPTMLRGKGKGLRQIFEKAGDEVTLRLLDAIPADLSMKTAPKEGRPDRVKSGVLDDAQYDYAHRKGNADAELANRIVWMGRADWEPKHMQAVNWTATRRSHGWSDADPADIFKKSDAALDAALRKKWEKRNSTPAERVRDTADVMSFISPNVRDAVPWRNALSELGDPYHRMAYRAFTESHNAVYPDAKTRPGLRSHPNVLGKWEDTGEVSVVKEHLTGTEWKDLRLEAALDGFAGRQKAVAIFERDMEPEPGTGQLAARAWELSLPKGLSIDRVVGAIDRRGFPGYSIEMEPNRETARRIWIVDPGNENAPRVQSLMKELDARGNFMDGRAEFLGKQTRDEAGKLFEGIIRDSGRKDLLEKVVLPVNAGRGRKGTDLARLAAAADGILKESTQQVKPIHAFTVARPLGPKELRAFEAEIGFKVRPPSEIPVVPALAQARTKGRQVDYEVVAFGENEYVTHPALARIGKFGDLARSGLTRGYIEKATGEFIDIGQTLKKYGKHESTDFWMKPEKVSGVARFRQGGDQLVEGELRGETEIPIGQPVSPEVQALMRFTRTADPVTAVHEMSHYAIEAMMTPAERRRLYSSLGAKDVDRIPDLLRERAAKQAEKYFRDGRAPTPELQPMFDRLAEVMRSWWVHSRDYWTGVGELKPETRRALDELLMPDTYSPAESRELSEATGYDAAHRHRKDMPGVMADAARAFQAAQAPIDPAGMVWRKNPTTGKQERVKWVDNINLDTVRGPEDWRAILLATGEHVGPRSQKRTEKLTWGEARARSDNTGLTPDEIKLGVSQERGAWVWDHTTMDRAQEIAVMLQGNVAGLMRRMKPKAINGTLTDNDKAQMIESVYQWRTFQDTLQAQVSEVARTLNIMRRVKSIRLPTELPIEAGQEEATRMMKLRTDQISAFEKQRAYTDMKGGFDWAKFASALEQPIGGGLAKTLNEVSRPSAMRAIEEIWTANLLTGFRTQARNIGSNTAFNLWRIPEMQTAGLIGEGRYLMGKLARIPVKDRVKITDAMAYTYGAVRSGEAIMTAMGRLLAEDPMINRLTEAGVFGQYHTRESLLKAREQPMAEGIEELLFEQKIKPEYRSAFGGQAFGLQGTGVGKALDIYGEAARTVSFTALQLGDAPFKVIGYNEEMSRLAFHKAAEERGGFGQFALGAPSFWERVAYHQEHPTRKMVEAAQENARYQTFTSDSMGPLARMLALGSRQIPLIGKQVLPFVQIGSNLFGAGMERSPLAPVITPTRFWGSIYGKPKGQPKGQEKRQFFPRGGHAFDEQMAKFLMGSSVSTFFAYQAAQGNFTGAGPPDYIDNMAWRQVYQPYSFRWTNPMTGKREWVSYRDLDPLAYVLGLGADFGASEEGKKALRELGDVLSLVADFTELSPYADPDATGEEAAKIVQAMSDLMTSRTYWMTAARFTEAITGKKEHQIRSALGNYVRSYTPRYAQQFRYHGDPYRRETRTADVNPLIRTARTALNDMRNTLSSTSRNLPPKMTEWGARNRVGGVVGPDLVSFIYAQEQQSDPVIREEARLGLSFPEMPWKVDQVRLGPWQRYHWGREAGLAAKAEMDQIVTDQKRVIPYTYWTGGRAKPMYWADMNDDERRAVMKGTVNKARSTAFDPAIYSANTPQGRIRKYKPGETGGLLPHMSPEKQAQIDRRRARP